MSVLTVEVISCCHQVSILSTYRYTRSFCQQLSWIWRWIKFHWLLNTCKEVNFQVKLYGLEVYILNLLYTWVKCGAIDWILQRWPPAADLWSAYLWISSTWVDWHPSEAWPSTWTHLHCATLSVTQNAAFAVRIDSLEFEDLKADDLGSSKGISTEDVLQSSAVWCCKVHLGKTKFKCSCTVPSFNPTLLCP